MADPTQRIEVQLSAGVWTNLTADVLEEQVRVKYGIDGSGPTDCVASTGECAFSLNNTVANSGAQQGWYSPLHASKRTGWTFGIPVQAVFSHDGDTAATVTITRVSQTATVAHTAHGKATGDHVTIEGATQAEYNGTWKITVTGANAYTFTVAGTPATPATGTITSRRAYVKHRGKARTIDPEPGENGAPRVHVVSYDAIRDLAETDLREVALQTNKSESDLLTALLAAVPTESQPVATDFDPGVDGFPYAFDDLGAGVKALSVIKDVAVSAFAVVVMKGDGTLRLISRTSRVVGSSAYTFGANAMHGLSVPAAMDQVFNVVRVTIHPRTISAAATEELYSLPTGSSIEIAAGATREVFTDYSDPNDRQTKVGGAEVVTALVASTHYAANSLPDGGGSNVTADITASLEAFASTAKWTLTNNGAATAYITTLKVIGKALRDPGPQTYEASSVQAYGIRPLNLDLKYQSRPAIAQSYADYVEDTYNSLADQIEAIEFVANYSSDFLTQALSREPGDIVTLSETVTGLSSVAAVIQSIELDVQAGVMTVRWGLAPANLVDAWIIEEVGSALGTNTDVGPF